MQFGPCFTLNMLWLLIVLLINGKFVDSKCFIDRTDARRNYFQYRGSPQVLTIESSDRVSHNITSNIFLIFLEEILGYDAVQIIYGDSFNISSALNHVSEIETDDDPIPPTAFFNLEVWAPPNFAVPRGQKVHEAGMIAPAGRFGWFVSNYANVSWQTFQELSSSKAFSVFPSEFDILQKLAVDPVTNGSYCPARFCSDNVYTPSWCHARHRIEPCALLLASHFDQTQVVVSHIEKYQLYVRVMWLGVNLGKALDALPKDKSFSRLIVTWSPDEITANDLWYPVAFPPCAMDEDAPGCAYETQRLIKLVSSRVQEGAPSAFEAVNDMEFTREQYLGLLKDAIANPKASHYDIACQWMRNNEDAHLPWTPSNDGKPTLNICGIFPMTGGMFGAGGLAIAAKMAVEAVNRNNNVLPDHRLIITNHDGKCNADDVMNTFINYILQSNSKQLVGILGPACSDTVEPLVGVTKYFRTVVISYSAEGSTFSNRTQYPHFFRTIGENQQFKHVYLLLLQRLGWKQIAALTEDGQKYTEYLSHLQDLLQTHNLTFITHRKFSRHRVNATMRNYLEDLRSRRARIIVADVHDSAARAVMCEALRLQMTAADGYVWFLPQWLSLNWFIVDEGKSPELHDCTTEMILKASQGHFSLAHQTLAPKNQVTHEQLTVEEWLKMYELNMSRTNYTMSAYAGYAYDAVWTYALALDELYRTNRSYFADIHSPNTTEKYVEIIQRTNFMGVSGRIQFLEGASRVTDVNILQWVNGSYHKIGSVVPQVSETSRKIEDYKLELNTSRIKWFTKFGQIPSDGEEISSCVFQSLADLLQVDCSGAIIFVNVVGFGLLAIVLVIAIAVTKYKYDKKVQKFEITEKYMKSMGFDLLSSNLSELDKWEIPRDCVVINRRLGEGAFGTVYGGEAHFKEQGWVAAAVKTLKTNSTTEQKLDFLSEAEVMKRFDHKNIVKLLGVCTRDEPVYTVMEFMLYGDLKTFLLNRRHLVNNRRFNDETNEVSNKKLTAMALDIARGLSYLASLKYVHRDIACRNCLLNSNRVAKIGDFGLTRPMYESDYYKFSRKGMLPIRWMAPESLADGLFTPSSDVWSFGVVLYEIVTFGSYPFQGLSNTQVMEHVKAGNTITIPKDVKSQLEMLIKSCWNLDYKRRPAASEIVEFLANNPRLLAPCLDVPASSVAVEDSEGLDLPFPARPSVPASPLQGGSFFPENSPSMGEAAAELGERPSSPSSPAEHSNSISFFPDSARELLLPARRPVQIALAPLMSRMPSNRDLQSGSLL